MAMSKDEKIVKEIVKRYGETLDLRGSPYVIVEIIRQFIGQGFLNLIAALVTVIAVAQSSLIGAVPSSQAQLAQVVLLPP